MVCVVVLEMWRMNGGSASALSLREPDLGVHDALNPKGEGFVAGWAGGWVSRVPVPAVALLAPCVVALLPLGAGERVRGLLLLAVVALAELVPLVPDIGALLALCRRTLAPLCCGERVLLLALAASTSTLAQLSAL